MVSFLCLFSAHENVVLLVNAMDWDFTCKDLIKRIVRDPDSNKYMMHCVNPILALQLLRNLLIRNSTKMKMMRNLITVSRI